MKTHLIQSNALHIPIADKSVHMVVTSPPYWGLRNYGVDGQLGSEHLHDCAGWATGNNCGECFVCHMRQVFAEVWRVLRDDGQLWLNLGDSYNGSGGVGGDYNAGGLKDGQPRYKGRNVSALKPKDLVGIPWRVALALQADGWYLRSDIIWAKPNPMPESVTDRPTKAHEYLFLLAKSPRYYYDAEAVRENGSSSEYDITQREIGRMNSNNYMVNGPRYNPGSTFGTATGTRNRRTVWNIATRPYSGAHFATYPPDLVEPCIKAGTSERGVCAECGAPWERVAETKSTYTERGLTPSSFRAIGQAQRANIKSISITTGWRATCNHDAPTVPAIVLDPFSGAGTTGLVCQQLGRRYVGLDLSMEYHSLARVRLGIDALNEWQNGKPAEAANLDGLPMFADLA